MATFQNKNTEYSIFSISGKLFGLELDLVREVIKFPHLTRLPNTSNQVLGIFNLRGDIISLFDIKKILGLDYKQPEHQDIVLVIGEQNQKISFLVNKVMDFISFEPSRITKPENGEPAVRHEFVSGVYQHEKLGDILILNRNVMAEMDNLVEART